VSFNRTITRKQREILDADLGFDDGGRYAVVSVSGYAIAEEDTFGVVFSLIDTESGDEVDISPAIPAELAREERRHWIARARHMNGREDQ
jgi:DNA gyrase inhibitor GyrI